MTGTIPVTKMEVAVMEADRLEVMAIIRVTEAMIPTTHTREDQVSVVDFVSVSRFFS